MVNVWLLSLMFFNLLLCCADEKGLMENLFSLVYESEYFPVFKESEYHNQIAYVAPATILSLQEEAYSCMRTSYIQDCWSKTARENCFATAPKIALCMSGGGVRAMIGSLGFWKALHEEGIFDLVSYISTLSGSTWALSGWLQSRLPLADYLELLKNRLSKGLIEGVSIKNIVNELAKKMRGGQSISLIDIWGVIIAEKMLIYSDPTTLSHITLSSYFALPDDGSLPLPMYNCVAPLGGVDGQLYRWVEWTPFTIRCPYLGSSIPVWALGRTFESGASIDTPSDASLSFCMGIWGAAISGNMQEFIRIITSSVSAVEKDMLNFVLSQMVAHSFFDEVTTARISPAEIPNWNFKSDRATLSDQKNITFIDAGFLCNIPLVPMIDQLRKVDIIIVMDFTLGNDSLLELSCMQNYAIINNLSFPDIHLEALKETCSVHGRGKADVPTIIYFPLVTNPLYAYGWNPENAEFTSTLNFLYTPYQVELLSGLTYFTAKQWCWLIKDIINERAYL